MCIINVSIITSFPKPRPQPERTNGMTLNPHSTNDLDIFRKIMALILHTFWIILTIVGRNLELKIYNLIFFFKAFILKTYSRQVLICPIIQIS